MLFFSSSTSENNSDQQSRKRKSKDAYEIFETRWSAAREQELSKYDAVQGAARTAKRRISQYKIVTQPTLIGDGTKNHCLPLIEGCHQDINSITAFTLRDLIKGEFNDVVDSYQIIDCRLPYEFEAGRIEDAINLYSKHRCLTLLTNLQPHRVNESHNSANESEKKRNILIFYGEFSKKRAPAM